MDKELNIGDIVLMESPNGNSIAGFVYKLKDDKVRLIERIFGEPEDALDKIGFPILRWTSAKTGWLPIDYFRYEKINDGVSIAPMPGDLVKIEEGYLPAAVGFVHKLDTKRMEYCMVCPGLTAGDKFSVFRRLHNVRKDRVKLADARVTVLKEGDFREAYLREE